MSCDLLLSVESATVELPTTRGMLRAVDGVDLSLAAGRTLGIVGESGSGKTMLSRAILQLLPRRARFSGRVRFDGHDLTRLDRRALRRLRGRSIAVVFQDPMTSLNPVLTIGQQMVEGDNFRDHSVVCTDMRQILGERSVMGSDRGLRRPRGLPPGSSCCRPGNRWSRPDVR